MAVIISMWGSAIRTFFFWTKHRFGTNTLAHSGSNRWCSRGLGVPSTHDPPPPVVRVCFPFSIFYSTTMPKDSNLKVELRRSQMTDFKRIHGFHAVFASGQSWYAQVISTDLTIRRFCYRVIVQWCCCCRFGNMILHFES